MMTPRSRMRAAMLAARLSRALVHQVREESAGQNRRGQLQRQINSQGEDHGRKAEHLQHHGDHGADAEQHIGDRLAAHESRHDGLQCGGLRRNQHLAQVAGRGLSELEGLGQQDDGQASGDGRATTPMNFTFSCAEGVEPIQ